ncbi:hypothetical protein LguiA_027752 [Lonicera macranthoides]
MSSYYSNVDSNLQCLLRSVTPMVPSKPIPQSCLYDINNTWKPAGKPITESFTLSDLWGCYDEWSAFGAGTQVLLNNGETLDQYYVPYLSGIQLYINKPPTPLRTPKQRAGAREFEIEFWSSDESKSGQLSRSSSNNSNKTWDLNFGDSGDLSPRKDLFGDLYFEYFDTGPPYWRIPLFERVSEYIHTYRGLTTLKNVDLSPASWMAVAWYPIYHVPAKISMKEMQACFITYHTLSAYYQDYFNGNEEFEKVIFPRSEVVPEDALEGRVKASNIIYLPPFGLATYKMQGDVWVNPTTSDPAQLYELQNNAYSWLRQLGVQHHDYNFFTLQSVAESGMHL